MNEEIVIRRMTFDDQFAFNFILEQYVNLLTTYQPKTNLPKALLAKKRFIENHVNNFFVVYSGNTFIGIFNLILQNNYYLITDMYVKENGRSHGYGSIILEKCKAKARFDSKDLRAIVDKTNIRGSRFFEKNNFENIGQSGNMLIYQLALSKSRAEDEIKRTV